MSDSTTEHERVANAVGDMASFAAEPQSVPVNMYRTSGAVVVVAPLPGVMADDIEVAVEAGTLTISAAMRTPAPKDYLLHEWHYGPFKRTVDIPGNYGAQITATFGNGQLAISLGPGEPRTGRVTVRPD